MKRKPKARGVLLTPGNLRRLHRTLTRAIAKFDLRPPTLPPLLYTRIFTVKVPLKEAVTEAVGMKMPRGLRLVVLDVDLQRLKREVRLFVKGVVLEKRRAGGRG